MLNFGPPCTRVAYSPETRTFDVVASCPFSPGQEVTLYYSDDCRDVVVANYGFDHPMIPRCPDADDWRRRATAWRDQARDLEEVLDASYAATDRLEEELEKTRARLRSCTDGGADNGGGGGGGGGGGSADPSRRGEDPGGRRRHGTLRYSHPPPRRDGVRGGGDQGL